LIPPMFSVTVTSSSVELYLSRESWTSDCLESDTIL
jgi:hypothetical protein